MHPTPVSTGPTLPRRLEAAAAEDGARIRWSHLTALPEKAAYYSMETAFRLAWRDVEDVCGVDATAVLAATASVLLRPDAVVGRRVEACVRQLVSLGFQPVAAVPVRLTRHQAFELWRYQHNAGTLDRLAATEDLMTAGESVVLVLTDRAPEPGTPAAVRLRRLKGSMSGEPSGTTGPTLRDVAGAVNRIMAMLHTADEPMDVVRELGVHLDGAARRRVLRACLAGHALPAAELARVLDGVHARNPAVALDPVAAAGRVAGRLAQLALAGHPQRRWLAATATAIRVAAGGGARLRWSEIAAGLDDVAIGLPVWDRVLVATHFIDYDADDDMLILGNGDAEWARRCLAAAS